MAGQTNNWVREFNDTSCSRLLNSESVEGNHVVIAFMRNSQLFHKMLVSSSYTKNMKRRLSDSKL